MGFVLFPVYKTGKMWYNQEESKCEVSGMKESASQKRKGMIAVICVLAVVIVLLIAVEILTRLLDDPARKNDPQIPQTQATEPIQFEESDPDYNIFEDTEWLDEDRYLHFSDGTEGTILTWESNERGPVGYLLLKYFDAVMHGDVKAYNACFTSDYLKEHGETDYFTMQRVYNINILLMDSYSFEEGIYAGYTRYRLRVDYCIMRNDGTFRDDIPSDRSHPVVFEVLSNGQQALIHGIEPIVIGQL